MTLSPSLRVAVLGNSDPKAQPGRGTLDALRREWQKPQSHSPPARSPQVLVAAQMALALVLLLSAGLMIRSFQALRSVKPRFQRSGAHPNIHDLIPATTVPRIRACDAHSARGVGEAVTVPGVASAAFTTRVPIGSDRSTTALTVEGVANDGQTPPNRQVKVVSPGLFRTLGISLLEGRDFTWTDVYDKRPVAILSENLARELFGSTTAALGKRVREYHTTRPHHAAPDRGCHG